VENGEVLLPYLESKGLRLLSLAVTDTIPHK